MDNEKQNVAIGKIQTDISYIKKTICRIEDKVDEGTLDRIVGFRRLRDYSNTTFVRKSDFEPIKNLYNKANAALWGVLILMGGAAIFFFSWIKDKLV